MSNSKPSVLIAGAGPTGLVLALWLTKIGIRVRIIDKTTGPGTTSRALAVHARTLEYYRQMGLADEVINLGLRFPKVHLWVDHRPKAELSIGEIGVGVSPYPFVLIFPQDQHEELLLAHLKKLGVEVERQTELLSFTQSEAGVRATLRRPSGASEECTVSYLAGCDGARSVVREQLGTGFQGSTYPGMFYVADIVGEGAVLNGDLHASLDKSDFLAIFPMKDKGHARLIGAVRTEEVGNKSLTWEDINPHMTKVMDIRVKEVRWFSTYHVHHRVASHFQKGRVFLLGDAGHIHSPVGGQGMNTGIGDAINLAWKLGEVLKGKCSTRTLESYETERIAFARELVESTDRAFHLISSRGTLARFIRMRLAPIAIPTALHFDFVKRFVFRTISQTAISYRHSGFNEGEAGELHAGDRLPWISSVDNFAPLKTMTWQVHVYGATKALGVVAAGVDTHLYEWNEEMATKLLQKGAAYLIRPDGYIGMISADGDVDEIRRYLISR
ncbi:MAG: FAD-dependent monooxygenase [Bdellovibrionales bacterium]|nr:FAD-dependent monooxygenase [Bdellovibrionales bacterium]